MAEVVSELVARMSFEADTSQADKFSESLDGAGNAADEMGENVDGAGVATVALGNIVANAASRLVDFAVNAAKQAVAALKDIVFGTSEAADEIAKMSKQLNVDAEQLQRLRGAADLSGASIQDMNRGVRALTQGLADAKLKGTGPVMDGFDALGLSVGEVEALLAEGNIEGAMGLIGDAFNETGESAEKNAALLKIFGARAGAQLRPLIESGTAGIRDMGDAIEATGEVIDNETLPIFEKMQDDLRKIQGASTGVKNQIAVALAPVVSDIATKFNEWIAENQDFIDQDLPEIMAMIAETLQLVLPWVIDVITEFKNFYTEMTKIDERLTQDWGPAWDATKDILWAVLNPLGEILKFVNRMIERVDRLIGRFRTVGDVAAEAAAAVGMGTTDQRGGVKNLNADARARAEATRKNYDADIARQDEARRQEDRARQERKQGLRAEIRQKQVDGVALTENDIQAMSEAGFTESEISRSVESARERQQTKANMPGGGGGGGGGGRGRKRSSKATDVKPAPSVEELIAGVGASASSASSFEGGGAGPGLGGNFTTINAPFTANNRIELSIAAGEVEGMTPAALGGVVAEKIRQALDQHNQEIYDHYRETLSA